MTKNTASRFWNSKFFSENKPVKNFLPAILWFLIVLVLMCLPGDDLPHTNNWFKQIYGDKIIHIGCFGLMVLLFIYPLSILAISQLKKWHYFIRITLAAIVWGLTTELIQKYFVPGRSFDWFDWAADSAGALSALWFCYRKFLK
jgi:VanZ family protein